MNAWIEPLVQTALDEDVGDGDISAALIPAATRAHARIITREPMVLCGVSVVDAVFMHLGADVDITWFANDGDRVGADTELCQLQGCARTLLTGERTALNFLQMLSATATVTDRYKQALKGSRTQLLDTRKTIPGFRQAQKYAVRCGGGCNHRLGLFDAYLIKENHISLCGSITQAVQEARGHHPEKYLEVEVESLEEYKEALAAGADRIMLDNFSVDAIRQAVRLRRGELTLEVSGGVSYASISALGALGVDYISVGALTKHIHAIDLSMQVDTVSPGDAKTSTQVKSVPFL